MNCFLQDPQETVSSFGRHFLQCQFSPLFLRLSNSFFIYVATANMKKILTMKTRNIPQMLRNINAAIAATTLKIVRHTRQNWNGHKTRLKKLTQKQQQNTIYNTLPKTRYYKTKMCELYRKLDTVPNMAGMRGRTECNCSR